jgi:hypothetical protein
VEEALWWFPALDSALLKFVPQTCFDFDKVAKALRSALLRGLLKPDGGSTTAATGPVAPVAAAVLDATAVRLRYARLQLPVGVPVPQPPSAATAPPPPAAVFPSGGTGVGSRAPIIPGEARPASGVGSTRNSGPATSSKADSSAAAARVVASVLGSLATTGARAARVVEEPWDTAAPAPAAARITPLAQLLQGEFALGEFREYVKPPTAPEMEEGGEEGEEEAPVSREELMRRYRK